MKKKELIIVAIVAIMFGTAMHFAHHLPFFNHFLGYIFPINESVWEHMKMLFYPMLLVSIYLCIKEKSGKPFGGMILSNLVSMPLQIFLFYAYEIFTHHSILVLDCIDYYLVMVFGIWFGNLLSKKEGVRKIWPWTIAIAVVVAVAIAYLTYNAPDMALFIPEE